jgi:DUF2934 family protein
MGRDPVRFLMKSPKASVSPPLSTKTPSAPSHENIAFRAQALWQQMGFPHGSDKAIWFEAERQLREHEPLIQADRDEIAFADPNFLFGQEKNSMMDEIDTSFPGPVGKETTSL